MAQLEESNDVDPKVPSSIPLCATILLLSPTLVRPTWLTLKRMDSQYLHGDISFTFSFSAWVTQATLDAFV